MDNTSFKLYRELGIIFEVTDFLNLIMNFLTLKDICRFSSICHWASTTVNNFTLEYEVGIHDDRIFAWIVSHNVHLIIVNISVTHPQYWSLDDDKLQAIALQSPNLRFLKGPSVSSKEKYCSFSKNAFQGLISSCPNLQGVDLELPWELYETLSVNCPLLLEVAFYSADDDYKEQGRYFNTSESNYLRAFIEKCVHLEKLKICLSIKDEDVVFIGQTLRSLKVLDVEDCRDLSPDFLNLLVDCDRLERVFLAIDEDYYPNNWGTSEDEEAEVADGIKRVSKRIDSITALLKRSPCLYKLSISISMCSSDSGRLKLPYHSYGRRAVPFHFRKWKALSSPGWVTEVKTDYKNFMWIGIIRPPCIIIKYPILGPQTHYSIDDKVSELSCPGYIEELCCCRRASVSYEDFGYEYRCNPEFSPVCSTTGKAKCVTFFSFLNDGPCIRCAAKEPGVQLCCCGGEPITINSVDNKGNPLKCPVTGKPKSEFCRGRPYGGKISMYPCYHCSGYNTDDEYNGV